MNSTQFSKSPDYLSVGHGAASRDIAMLTLPAQNGSDLPALMWLGGYRSDMTGTKAVEMEALAARRGCQAIRFDYSGHGQSRGEFREGTISRWLEEAQAVLDHHAPDKVVLVGSSMGGWIALRLTQRMREKGKAPAGLVLIAPAPDFTSELIEPNLTEADRKSLEEKGYFEEHSDYSSDPNIFTRALIEDGRANRVLNGIIETGCPAHILQGMKDPDVPFSHALRLMEHLPADDVVLTLIRDGDHRLSRPEDLAKMVSAIEAKLAPSLY